MGSTGFVMEAPMWLVVGAAMTAAIQLVGHWFPWQVWLGRELPRVPSYVWGLVGVVLGFAVWAVASGHVQSLVALVIIVVAAGAAVMTAYGVDRVGLAWSQARIANRRMADDEE